jgi:hypothetical protein
MPLSWHCSNSAAEKCLKAVSKFVHSATYQSAACLIGAFTINLGVTVA